MRTNRHADSFCFTRWNHWEHCRDMVEKPSMTSSSVNSKRQTASSSETLTAKNAKGRLEKLSTSGTVI